jgi:hypothetical protein
MREQPPLAVNPATIPGQACIRADDTVATNHDGNRIGAVGNPDGASAKASTGPRSMANRDRKRGLIRRP